MTYLALRFAHYVNGVAMPRQRLPRHVSSLSDNAITNGVHAITWTVPPFCNLYDRRIPEWRHDNFYLRYAVGIPLHEIQQAHAEAKRELLAVVEKQTGVRLPEDVMRCPRGAPRYISASICFLGP